MPDDDLFSLRLGDSEALERGLRHDRLLIRDLILRASIGIHAHEHLAPQRVKIDVELRVDKRTPASDDDISSVVSYEEIVEGIRKIVDQGHIKLVETLAERIAKLCLRDERVVSATIRVEKPDIEPDAAGVGVEIHRRRRSDVAAGGGVRPAGPS